MEAMTFDEKLGQLDRLRTYRLGVCDVIDCLVKGHEEKYGEAKLWADGVKGYKKHNKEQRLKSEGYLEAYRDVLSHFNHTNSIQLRELSRYANWAEEALDDARG